jgi:hypothetical protein
MGTAVPNHWALCVSKELQEKGSEIVLFLAKMNNYFTLKKKIEVSSITEL